MTDFALGEVLTAELSGWKQAFVFMQSEQQQLIQEQTKNQQLLVTQQNLQAEQTQILQQVSNAEHIFVIERDKFEQLQQQQQQLLGEHTQGQLQQQLQQIQHSEQQRYELSQQHKYYAEFQQQLSQLNQSLNQHQQTLAQFGEQRQQLLTQYKSIKPLLDKQKIIVEQQSQIMDLALLRAQLQADQACPLCGSTSHPLVTQYSDLDQSVAQLELADLEMQVAQITDQGKAAKLQCENEQTYIDDLVSRIDAVDKQCQELILHWQQTCQTLAVKLDIDDNAALQQYLDQNNQIKQSLVQQLDSVNEITQQLLVVERQQYQQTEQIQQIKYKASTIEANLLQLVQQLSECSSVIERICDQQQQQLLHYQTIMQSHGLTLPNVDKLLPWLAQLETKLLAWQQAKQLLATTEPQLTQLQADQKHCELRLDELQQFFVEHQQQVLELQTLQQQAQDERHALFADKVVDTELEPVNRD